MLTLPMSLVAAELDARQKCLVRKKWSMNLAKSSPTRGCPMFRDFHRQRTRAGTSRLQAPQISGSTCLAGGTRPKRLGMMIATRSRPGLDQCPVATRALLLVLLPGSSSSTKNRPGRKPTISFPSRECEHFGRRVFFFFFLLNLHIRALSPIKICISFFFLFFFPLFFLDLQQLARRAVSTA